VEDPLDPVADTDEQLHLGSDPLFARQPEAWCIDRLTNLMDRNPLLGLAT
jgi:hypothetical protein